MKNEIPEVNYAFIGGSSTYSISFPEDISAEWHVIGDNLTYETPFGKSPPFKLVQSRNARFITCKMHGWRQGVTRRDASLQVFWVLQQAKVKKVLAEGGVGSINHLLKPKDLVISSDYLDYSMRKDVTLDNGFLSIMRQPVCSYLAGVLQEEAEKNSYGRVFDRGNYVVTDGRHFESVAEVQAFKILGGDIIGQSMCPEVYLSREIGACYARIDMVVNYAEGVVKAWQHSELEEIFFDEAKIIGKILLNTLAIISSNKLNSCNCQEFRKLTLLK